MTEIHADMDRPCQTHILAAFIFKDDIFWDQKIRSLCLLLNFDKVRVLLLQLPNYICKYIKFNIVLLANRFCHKSNIKVEILSKSGKFIQLYWPRKIKLLSEFIQYILSIVSMPVVNDGVKFY